MKTTLTESERVTFKAELETITRIAGKLTKAELVKAHPGYGLDKYTKAELVTRAIALHMAAYEGGAL